MAFLLCQPLFAVHAATLYADVPLGFYFLAAFLLIAIHDRAGESKQAWLALAGTAAGMAAWTKIEGMIFVLALAAARTLMSLSAKRFRILLGEAAFFGLGLLPWMLLILYFRLNLPDRGPSLEGALVSGHLTFFQKILEPTRHWLVLKYYAREIFLSPSFSYVGPILLLSLYAAFSWRGRILSWSQRSLGLSLALLLMGYYGAYLLSPHDLDWHLRFSIDRLLLQTWPSFVFLILNSSATKSSK